MIRSMLNKLTTPFLGTIVATQIQKKLANRAGNLPTDTNYSDKEITATAIIQQSFKDYGFTGPVNIEYIKPKTYLGFNMRSFAFANKNEHAAHVKVIYKRDTELDNHELLYSIGGHEAAHCAHKHGVINWGLTHGIALGVGLDFFRRLPLSKFMFRLPPLLLANYVFSKIVSKSAEVDADISSAKKLGTAYALISFFKNDPEEKSSLMQRLTSTHPAHATRIKYLSMLRNPGEPLFFKSELYQQLQKEKSQQSITNIVLKRLAPC